MTRDTPRFARPYDPYAVDTATDNGSGNRIVCRWREHPVTGRTFVTVANDRAYECVGFFEADTGEGS